MTIIATHDALLAAVASRQGDGRLGASSRSLAARVAAAWAARRARARAARDLRILRNLDDHILGDIGLSRGNLYHFE